MFYSELGLNFLGFGATKYFYGLNNFFIVLDSIEQVPNKSLTSRSLYFIKDNEITKFHNHVMDENEACVIADLYNQIKDFNLVDQQKKIIPIIRSSNIEEDMLNYSHLGKWTKEKHGTGPEHYCLLSDITAEIYPMRKSNPIEKVELVFDGYVDLPRKTNIDPDGENVVVI